MVTDKSEEEQVEALKNWFKENGTSLVVGIVLALGGVFGYQSWQNSIRQSGEEASALFQDLMETAVIAPTEQLDEERRSTGKFITDQLKSDYEDSTYAHFAAMLMGKLAVEAGDLEGAESELRWILKHDADESVAVIARQRLARVLLAQDRAEEALDLLEGVDAGAHTSSYEEVKGDIYLKLGREGEARGAYQRAVDSIVGDAAKPILEMKLKDLAEPETVIPDHQETAESGTAKTGAN